MTPIYNGRVNDIDTLFETTDTLQHNVLVMIRRLHRAGFLIWKPPERN